jgi:hypothetical protein
VISMAEMIVKSANVKIPIGTLLLADELIVPQDLDFALEHQKHSRMLLGEILVRIGALTHDDLDRSLKLQSCLFTY